jgi:hypothetical protein
MTGERFLIELAPTGRDTRPPAIRLRGLLKLALRAFGLRCVAMRETRDEIGSPESTEPTRKAGP